MALEMTLPGALVVLRILENKKGSFSGSRDAVRSSVGLNHIDH